MAEAAASAQKVPSPSDIQATVYPPAIPGQRFNMKCLDYGFDEVYFVSVQAEAVHRYADPVSKDGEPPPRKPPPHPMATNEQGVLHICSHSLVFEPTGACPGLAGAAAELPFPTPAC